MGNTPLLTGLITGSFSGGLSNLDLFANAFAVLAIAGMAYVVFLGNPKSATHRAFLLVALFNAAYAIANFASYHLSDPTLILWSLRIVIASATLYSFFVFHLFYVFPAENVRLPAWYRLVIIPAVFVVVAVTLSPWAFTGLARVGGPGEVSQASQGPGIILFAAACTFLVVAGIAILSRRAMRATGLERKQCLYLLIGALITYTLLIVFNMIFPTVFGNVRFIPYAPLFTLPLIIFTAHAIRKYRLLDTKFIMSEIVIFGLGTVTLIQILIADDAGKLLVSLGALLFVIVLGILLIKSIAREEAQRDQLRELSEDLSYATTRLQDLDRLKSQFLSFASHQLRAPLTAIRWQAQVITDGTLGKIPAKVKDAAQQIDDSIAELVALVNDFLDIRKLEEGRMEFSMAPLDVAALAKHVVGELSALATRKGLKLTVTVPDRSCMVVADEQKFAQVIQNLVENSIKYTDTGSVAVSVAREDSSVIIAVTDTGHGLSADLIPKLFDQFMRSPGEAKSIEGTGLGLYIAKQIVVAHQGTIWVESPGPGKGSSFKVRIPAAPETHIPAP